MQQIGRWSIMYYVMLPENGWSNITIYCWLITVISQSSCHTSIPCFQFIKLTPVSSLLPYYLGYDENWPSQTQTADLEVVRYSLQHQASGERCQLTDFGFFSESDNTTHGTNPSANVVNPPPSRILKIELCPSIFKHQSCILEWTLYLKVGRPRVTRLSITQSSSILKHYP